MSDQQVFQRINITIDMANQWSCFRWIGNTVWSLH